MIFNETGIEGLWEIEPPVYRDQRGYFLESFQLKKFQEMGITGPFVQDNQSFSTKGVLRGLHFQKAPFEQGKLVSVAYGSVLDVVVDLRSGSATFGQHYKCLLQEDRHNMLYIPGGFAHGFLVLDDALFVYKCTDYYHKESELGIRWDDETLAIDWGYPGDPVISDKDTSLPGFTEVIKKLQ